MDVLSSDIADNMGQSCGYVAESDDGRRLSSISPVPRPIAIATALDAESIVSIGTSTCNIYGYGHDVDDLTSLWDDGDADLRHTCRRVYNVSDDDVLRYTLPGPGSDNILLMCIYM
jgi:hypothetical protein